MSSVIGMLQYLNDLSEVYQYLSENFIKELFILESGFNTPC